MLHSSAKFRTENFEFMIVLIEMFYENEDDSFHM